MKFNFKACDGSLLHCYKPYKKPVTVFSPWGAYDEYYYENGKTYILNYSSYGELSAISNNCVK